VNKRANRCKVRTDSSTPRLTKGDMQCKHPYTGTERATGPCFCRCHCRVSWLPQLLRIQSSKEDTGQKGQASANKGRTRTRTRKHATSHYKHNTRAPTVTCCFVLLNWYWGINERSQGFFTSEPREYVPTIENRRRTTSPWPPSENLGWPAWWSSTTLRAIPIPSSSSSNGPSN